MVHWRCHRSQNLKSPTPRATITRSKAARHAPNQHSCTVHRFQLTTGERSSRMRSSKCHEAARASLSPSGWTYVRRDRETAGSLTFENFILESLLPRTNVSPSTLCLEWRKVSSIWSCSSNFCSLLEHELLAVPILSSFYFLAQYQGVQTKQRAKCGNKTPWWQKWWLQLLARMLSTACQSLSYEETSLPKLARKGLWL